MLFWAMAALAVVTFVLVLTNAVEPRSYHCKVCCFSFPHSPKIVPSPNSKMALDQCTPHSYRLQLLTFFTTS